MTALDVFAIAAAVPERVALITPERAFTYAELAERCEGAARALAALGAIPGQRPVALVLRPTVASLVPLLALIAYGVPVLLLHPRLPTADRAALAHRAGAVAVLTPDAEPLPGARGSAPSPPRALDPDSPLALVPTSGSSGAPKLVVLSRSAFVASARASAANLPLGPDDRWLLCLPVAHVGGLSIVTRALAAHAAVIAYDPGSAGLLARVPELASVLRRTGATLLSAVPTLLRALLDASPRWSPPPTLRAVLLGGAATPVGLLERARARHVPVLVTYGLTEACSQVTTTPLGTEPVIADGRVSAGRVLPGIELALDEQGRIRLRGPTLCAGYLDGEAPFDADGFLVTDDLGRLDEHGNLFVLGRASERIVTGGENVDPAQVEAVLHTLEGVSSACVFGVPDERFGELVACALAADARFSASSARALLERSLVPHARPRRLAVFDSLPHLPNGKLDRVAVKRLAAERLEPWSSPASRPDPQEGGP
ncbi:MAG TPA: AMP-binding protein [Polyangiaceae bacterium]|nr:AMP-binding protein [Polyangiaceae bacterium]